jgi:hypothetical protein
MKIVLQVVAKPVAEFVKPGHGGPGYRFAFSENLDLVSIDGKTPPAQVRAGTFSGFGTTLRISAAGDDYFPAGGHLLQVEGTFRLNALAGGLQEGQITARGVSLTKNDKNVGTPMFAITGGTQTYANARGQVTETTEQGKDRHTLDIAL